MNQGQDPYKFVINNPVIYVKKEVKEIGVFDSFHLIRGFDKYEDQETAIEDLRQWCRKYAYKEPYVVFCPDPHEDTREKIRIV